MENFVRIRFNKIPGSFTDTALPPLDGELLLETTAEMDNFSEICGLAGERVNMRLFVADYAKGFALTPQMAGEPVRGGKLMNYVNPKRTSTRECAVVFWKLD
jgi:hypothetical protein